MSHPNVRQLPQPVAALQSAISSTGCLAEHHESANRLLDVAQYRHEPLPLSDELRWLKDLCGEVVQGGVYLLGGAPGGFKSGLALQLSLDLNRQGVRTLSILTEDRHTGSKNGRCG